MRWRIWTITIMSGLVCVTAIAFLFVPFKVVFWSRGDLVYSMGMSCDGPLPTLFGSSTDPFRQAGFCAPHALGRLASILLCSVPSGALMFFGARRLVRDPTAARPQPQT